MTITPEINATKLAELGLTKTAQAKGQTNELGQPEFFDLMLAQLKYQDPTKPVDNADFVGQMAQFSTVNSLSAMEGSLTELVGVFHSNQALQASTLVGRDVLVPTDIAVLGAPGTSAHGAVELPQASAEVSITVLDAKGVVVRNIPLGAQAAGRTTFSWDGLDNDDKQLPAGNYEMKAQVLIGDEAFGAQTLTRTRVDSVTLRQNPPGATLNLAGLGAVDMSAVKELL